MIDLKAVEDELKRLQTIQLPDELLCQGINEMSLTDGTKLSLSKEFQGGISYANGPDAARILSDLGYETPWSVRVEIPKDKVPSVLLALEGLGVPEIKSKPELHHQTYKKILKELDRDNLLTPELEQTLGVVTSYLVKVKAPE